MKKTLQEIDREAKARYVEHARKVRKHLADGKIARWKDLEGLGVTQSSLAAMQRRNILTRVGYGSYQLSEEERAVVARMAANTDAAISGVDPTASCEEELSNYLEPFSEVIARAPNGVICLLSASAFHSLTLDVPHEVWLCIGRNATKPKIDYPPIRTVHWRASASLESGVDYHSFRGMTVPITGLERTVVDLYRSQASLPDATAPRRALTQAMSRKEFDRGLFMKLARELASAKKHREICEDVEILDLVSHKWVEDDDVGSRFGM